MKFVKKNSGRPSIKPEHLTNLARFKAEGRSPYVYMKTGSRFSEQARVGRVFIYTLMFNAPGLPLQPFYVGAAPSLSQRMASNRFASWHVNRFDRAVKVQVIGTIPETVAMLARKNLSDRLVQRGFLLKDIGPGKRGYLGRMTESQLVEYTAALPDPGDVFESWRSYWREHERDTAVAKTVDPPTVSIVTRADLMKLVQGRYYGSVWATKLAQQLAATYDPRTGSSTHLLPYRPLLKTRQSQLSQFNENLAALNGDWYVDEEIMTDRPFQVKLSTQLRQAVAKSKVSVYTPGRLNTRASKFTAEEIAAWIVTADLPREEKQRLLSVTQWFDQDRQVASVPREVLADELVDQIWLLRENNVETMHYILGDQVKVALLARRDTAVEPFDQSILDDLLTTPAVSTPMVSKKQLLQYTPDNLLTTRAMKLSRQLVFGWDEMAQHSRVVLKIGVGAAAAADLAADIALLQDYWFTDQEIHAGEITVFQLRYGYAKMLS